MRLEGFETFVREGAGGGLMKDGQVIFAPVELEPRTGEHANWESIRQHSIFLRLLHEHSALSEHAHE